MKTLIQTIAAAGFVIGANADTNRVEKVLTGSKIYPTIGEAIAASVAGDTIQIGPGIYSENVVVPRVLTLIGAGPQFVTIRGSTTSAAISAEDSSVTPKGTVIKNLTISNPMGDGVNSGGWPLRIENCVIANCDREAVVHDGTGLIALRQCTIALNGGFAIRLANRGGSSLGIDGCILYKNNEAGTSQDTVNIPATSFGIHGCLVIGKPVISSADPAPVPPGEPNFFDAAAGNFILKAPSAAINTGRSGASGLDPDGTVPDVGAYGGPGAADFWPYPAGGPTITDLQVTPVVSQGAKVSIKATATSR